jgi:hypothetical protein
MKVIEYGACECGAVTLFFENGENNSVKRSNLKKFGLTLRGAKKIQDYYCCNHCTNHYGLDICECGSGKAPKKCCHKGAREQLGKSVKRSFTF